MGKRTIAVAIMVTILSGCATTRTAPAPEEVLIPVPAECPAPPQVERPALPIGWLPAHATASEVMQAQSSTIWALMGYAEQLEILLDAYRVPNAQTQEVK